MDQNYLFDKNVYSKLFVAMVKKDPYLAPYLFYLQKRARIKYNFEAIIGDQGSGKSYWSIVESVTLDPTFTIERIVFGTINFLDALDTLEDRTLKGRNIMWDDAGVGLPAQEWFSVSNKVINLVGQTARTLHPTIKFTMPDMKNIDPSQRRSITAILDCFRSTSDDDRTRIRVYTSKRIRLMDKNIHRKFTFKAGAMVLKLGEIRVKHFPQDKLPEILREYEELQKKFKYNTRKKLKELLETLREKKLTTDAIHDYTTITLSDLEKKTILTIYKVVFNDPGSYINNKRKIDIDKLMLEHKVSDRIAKIIAKFWRKKLTPELAKDELEIEDITTE